MSIERILLILWLQASIIGTAALVGYVVGRRQGWFRGVCRGMHCAGKMFGQGDPLPDFDREYREAFRGRAN